MKLKKYVRHEYGEEVLTVGDPLDRMAIYREYFEKRTFKPIRYESTRNGNQHKLRRYSDESHG